MGVKTGISWTHHTFNLWWGCVHAAMAPGSSETSPECDNCYAETFDRRVGGKHWGPNAPRRFFDEKYWRKPLAWNAAAEAAGVRARVFCASMADWAEVHPDHAVNVVMHSYRIALFELIQQTPWLDWLLLTKRAERLPYVLPWMMARRRLGVLRMGEHEIAEHEKPWPNVWVGVTCGARSSLWRIAELRKVRAAVRFVSAEPLLEHITDSEWDDALRREVACEHTNEHHKSHMIPLAHPIDWLIVGDESGAGARPAQVDWVRTARDAALRHRVAFHFKQWAGDDAAGITHELGDRKGRRKIHLPILDGRRWPDVPASITPAD